MDMNTLSLLQALAPTVHPLDQTRALQECTALVNKFKARKQYHEQMDSAEVDIFNDKLPRANNHPEDGVAAPWSERSKLNFLANVKTVFRLQRPCTCTAADLCEDCKSECHADGSYQWAMDTDKCIKCAYTTMVGKGAAPRTAMERLFSIATLCEMIHTPEALQAREKYLEHCRGVKAFHESTKRKRTDDQALVIDTDADLPMQEQPEDKLEYTEWNTCEDNDAVSEDAMEILGESDGREICEAMARNKESVSRSPVQSPTPASSPHGSDTDSLDTGDVEGPTDLLKTVRTNLLKEYDRLCDLESDADTFCLKKQFATKARDWLLFAAWLGVGDLYVDTLVPMRTDLETARFGHELQQDSTGDLWFTTPRGTGCTKTGKPIRWNITKHSPAVSKILLALKKLNFKNATNSDYIWPKASDPNVPQSATYLKNTRKRKADQGRAFGLPVGKHHINAMRHISRRDMPPRTPDEAEDMASRRGSTAAEMMKYGTFATQAASA
jgi:hypothetical protein